MKGLVRRFKKSKDATASNDDGASSTTASDSRSPSETTSRDEAAITPETASRYGNHRSQRTSGNRSRAGFVSPTRISAADRAQRAEVASPMRLSAADRAQRALVSPRRLRAAERNAPTAEQSFRTHSMNSSLSTPHRSGSFTPSEAGTFAESTDGTLRSTINPVFASSPQASRYGPSSNGSPAIQLRGALPSAQGRGHQHGYNQLQHNLLASTDRSQPLGQDAAADQAQLSINASLPASQQDIGWYQGQQAESPTGQSPFTAPSGAQQASQRLSSSASLNRLRSVYEQSTLRRTRSQAIAADPRLATAGSYTVAHQLLGDNELQTLRQLYQNAAVQTQAPPQSSGADGRSRSRSRSALLSRDTSQGASQEVARDAPRRASRDTSRGEPARHQQQPRTQPGQQRQSFQQQARLGSVYNQAMQVEPRNDGRRPSVSERERVAAVHREEVIARYLAAVDGSPSKPLGRSVSQPVGLLRNGGYQLLHPDEMSQIESWAAQTQQRAPSQRSRPSMDTQREYSTGRQGSLATSGAQSLAERLLLASNSNIQSYEEFLAALQEPRAVAAPRHTQQGPRDSLSPAEEQAGMRQSSPHSMHSRVSMEPLLDDMPPASFAGPAAQQSSQHAQQGGAHGTTVPAMQTPAHQGLDSHQPQVASHPLDVLDTQTGLLETGHSDQPAAFAASGFQTPQHHAQHAQDAQRVAADQQGPRNLPRRTSSGNGSFADAQHVHAAQHAAEGEAGPMRLHRRTSSGSDSFADEHLKSGMLARFEVAARAAERLNASDQAGPASMALREVAPPETPEQLTDPSPKAGTAGSPEEHADAVEASTPNQASRATAWFHRLMFAQAQAQPTRDGNSMASQRLKNYHSAEVAQINQDMQSALQAAEHQIDTLRMRVRSQRAGLAEGGNVMQTSQSMPSIADSDDLQAERDVKQLRKVIERMQQEMAAMEDELSYLREERSVVELEALAQKDEVESMAANLQASEAANIQLTQALQQVERELAQKKAIIRTDGNHKVVADLEDTIELLRGELDELRQGMAASTTPLHGSRPRSLGSGNRDTDLVDMAAELEQAGAAQRELEADMERLRQQSAEQHDALQLVQGELEVEREKSLHLREAMERLEAENKALSDAQLRSGGGSGSLAEGGAVLVRSASRDASLARQLSELTRKNVELGDDLNKALDMAEKKMKENEALQERCWRAEAVASKQTAAAESALAAEKQAVEEQKTRLEQEVQLLSAEVERMAGQVTQAEGLAEEAMNLVEQEGATTTQLKAELAALQASSAEARAELEQLRGGANGAGSSESQAAVAELEAYRQQVAELTEQLAAKEAEMTALRAEVEQKDAALGDLDALSDKLDALEAAEATAQRLRDEHAASTSAAAEATAKLQLVEAELQRLQSQGAGEEASPVASASAEPGDVHLREMQHQLQQTGEKLQAAEAEVQRLQRDLDASQGTAVAAAGGSAGEAAEEKLREAEAELLALQQALAKAEGAAAAAEQQLEQAHAAHAERHGAQVAEAAAALAVVQAALQQAKQEHAAEVKRLLADAEAGAGHGGMHSGAQASAVQEVERKLQHATLLHAESQRELQHAEAAHAAVVAQLQTEAEEKLRELQAAHAAEMSRLQAEVDAKLQSADAARSAEFVSRAEAEALLERAQSAHEEEIRELQLKVEAKLQTAEAAHAAELQLRSEVEGELQKARTLHAGEISRLRSELESQLQRSGSDAARAAHAASHPVSATRSGSAYNPTGLDTMDIFFEPSSPAHPVLSPQDLVTAALTSQEIAGLMSHPIMRRPSLDDNDELFRTVSDGSAVLPPDLGLAELRAENQRLRRQVAELEAQLQQPRLEQQSSGSDSKLMAEFARLKSKLAESSKAVSEAASLRADLEVLNVNLASKNAEINQLRGSIKLLEAQVEETQRAVAQCSGKVVGAQQRMFEESEKLDALRQEHAMLKMKYAELQSDYEAAVANRRRQ